MNNVYQIGSGELTFDIIERIINENLKLELMPEELRGIVKCANPKCITNNEPMATLFHVIDKEHGILKCHYNRAKEPASFLS